MDMRSRRIPLALAAAVMALAVGLTACSARGGPASGPEAPGADAPGTSPGNHAGPAAGAVVAPVAVALGMDVAGSAGFHGMAEALAQGTLEPTYEPRVRHVLAALKALPWPEALRHVLEAVVKDAESLAGALASGDVGAAAAAGEALHSSQHHFSDAAREWLAQQPVPDGETDPLVQRVAVLTGLDTVARAGFHQMAERLAEGTVEPRDATRVTEVVAALGALPWPADLDHAREAFRADADALLSALAGGDAERAAHVSHAIHSSQHHFTDQARAWLAGQAPLDPAGVDPATGRLAVLAGLDVVEGAGFHAMAEALEGGTVEPRYEGTVRHVLAVLRVLPWPAELESALAAFVEDTEALAGALAAGDAQAAARAGHAIHGSQHHFTELAREWIAGQEGAGFVSAEGHMGGHMGGHGTGEARAQRRDDAQAVTLTIRDWGFEPDTLVLPAGKVDLVVTNEGKMPHGIWLRELNVNLSVPAGETRIVHLDDVPDTAYPFACNNPLCGTIEQHAQMQGTLRGGD